jgi:putative ABC transport system permease protein
MIVLRHVSKSFGKRKILDDLNFVFPENGFFLLTGHNQSGKTTLLYLLGLLDYDYQGEIAYDGKVFSSVRESEEYRRQNISFLFSHGNLISYLNVSQNLSLGTRQKGTVEGIPDTQNSAALSGGEEIRVSLQREEEFPKKILLLDEITSALDRNREEEILQTLKNLSQNRLILLATHDVRVMKEGRRLTLQDGHLYD